MVIQSNIHSQKNHTPRIVWIISLVCHHDGVVCFPSILSALVVREKWRLTMFFFYKQSFLVVSPWFQPAESKSVECQSQNFELDTCAETDTWTASHFWRPSWFFASTNLLKILRVALNGFWFSRLKSCTNDQKTLYVKKHGSMYLAWFLPDYS